MFSGVITHVGKILSNAAYSSGSKVVVSTDKEFKLLPIGASVATNGICLTVAEISDSEITFDIASETIRVTTVPFWKPGDKVHLEPSLRVGDPIDGHFVSGHVDAVTSVAKISIEGETSVFTFNNLPQIKSFITRKGSIAIDGVSLTLGEVTEDYFSVYIVPHTKKATLFSSYKIESKVNIEVDMLARYVFHQSRKYF